eukprot:s1437_g2.t1
MLMPCITAMWSKAALAVQSRQMVKMLACARIAQEAGCRCHRHLPQEPQARQRAVLRTGADLVYQPFWRVICRVRSFVISGVWLEPKLEQAFAPNSK